MADAGMTRDAFHARFGSGGKVILPVIHVLDVAQTTRNMDMLMEAGIPGCFLINHDFDVDMFLPVIREIRKKYPDYWMGVNFLGVTGLDAFPVLAGLEKTGARIDAYWADDARIDEREAIQHEAEAITQTREASGWQGMYFGGTAFKKQRPVAAQDYSTAARIAGNYMDVVTTSGVATGNAADPGKIRTFRAALPHTPIALASGITPANAKEYAAVDCFMVATGINLDNDFYVIDPAKLRALIRCCREMEGEA